MLAFITLCEFRHIVMLKSFPLAYLSRRLQRECVINNKTWRGGCQLSSLFCCSIKHRDSDAGHCFVKEKQQVYGSSFPMANRLLILILKIKRWRRCGSVNKSAHLNFLQMLKWFTSVSSQLYFSNMNFHFKKSHKITTVSLWIY